MGGRATFDRAGDSTGGRARSLRKRRCQSPVERDAATERDCVSAFEPETGPSLPKVRFVFGFTVLSLFDGPQSASDGIWNMLFSSVRCLG